MKQYVQGLLPNHGEKAMNIPRKLTFFQKIP